MSRSDALDLLQGIFHEVFADDKIVITDETTANDIKGWDFYRHIELLVAIQIKLNIKLRSQEIENLRCVGDLLTLIEKRRG